MYFIFFKLNFVDRLFWEVDMMEIILSEEFVCEINIVFGFYFVDLMVFEFNVYCFFDGVFFRYLFKNKILLLLGVNVFV